MSHQVPLILLQTGDLTTGMETFKLASNLSIQLKSTNNKNAHQTEQQTYLCFIADAPLLQYASMLLSLVVQLGLEKGEVVPQLVVLRPVLLCLLKRTTSTHITP